MKNSINNTEKDCRQSIGIFGDGSCILLDKYGHCRHCPEYSKTGRRLLDRQTPPEFKKEWEEIYSQPQKEPEIETESYLIFGLKGERFGIKTEYFEEAVKDRSIHSVPFRSGNLIRGLVNVNGELLICVSLSALMELGSGDAEEGKLMLVISCEGARYVFPAEEIYGIYRIKPEKIQEPPSTVSKAGNSFTTGTYVIKKKEIGIIDADRLFKALERSFVW